MFKLIQYNINYLAQVYLPIEAIKYSKTLLLLITSRIYYFYGSLQFAFVFFTDANQTLIMILLTYARVLGHTERV